MDFGVSFWDKIWGTVAAMLSAAFSFVLYRHKKGVEEMDKIKEELNETNTLLDVFEERFKHLNAAIEEIKRDLKKILFKL